MVTEDFSFPKISNSVSQLAFSPSLWRVTSLVYPEFGDEDENGGDHGREEALQSKSFSHLERTIHEANDRGGGGGCHNLDAEKMDMLWEDFNEELKLEGRVRLSSSKFKIKAEAAASREKEEEESLPPPTTVELRYAKALQLQVSKASVGGGEMEIYHKRRLSISKLALMKTFKKILFLRQTRTSRVN